MNTTVKIENYTDNELVIREGKAPDMPVPRIVHITGDIDSVCNYLKIRRKAGEGYQEIDTATAIILVNRTRGTIKLSLDPVDPYAPEITAALEESDELKPFKINQAVTFTKEEFIKLLRFNRFLFQDSDKHAQVLTAYQSFSAKAYIDMKQEQADQKGSRSSAFSKRIESNIPDNFVMVAPVFKGQPFEAFRVDIWLDVTEAGARFWLESVELMELAKTRRDQIFDEQLAAFSDFVIINQ